MIIVKLQGGLGNQLFQYAAGLALAHRHNTSLKVDSTFLKQDAKGHYTQRYLELPIFNTEIKEANETDLSLFTFNENKYWRRLKKQVPHWFNTVVMNESQINVESIFFKLPSNTYLNGYWQSEKYFLEIRETLLQQLIIKPEYLKNIENEVALIKSASQSVAVHVRRGDYVTLSSANEFHGSCDVNYYQEAANQFSNATTFFVFSDDLEWCKQNLNFKSKTHYINSPTAYTDFYLMSQCQHQIIANSSFSWWAAWLNTNASKKIIAPKHWFVDKSLNTSDIYPSNWIKL
jgi:hypothetical protein